jgi:hypothetical protein
MKYFRDMEYFEEFYKIIRQKILIQRVNDWYYRATQDEMYIGGFE